MKSGQTDGQPQGAPTDVRLRLPRSISGIDRARNPKASEVVARDIANHIIDAGLPEGTMLPTEREMIGTLGVGRTTLREALRLLETRGVLRVRPGPRGGPVVRRPRPADLSGALTLMLSFEGASLADVIDARETLEPAVAALAAHHVSDEQVAQLEDSIQATRKINDDQEEFLYENARFHGIVAEAAHSVVLWVFTESLKSIADGAVAGVKYDAARLKAVADAHQRILEALEARDPTAAATQMRAHLQEARTYWERDYPDLMSRPVNWEH